tara:strand:+ start:21735 stop:22340 length:606 start_codon:yes stop_codon:yes gene_type:complete
MVTKTRYIVLVHGLWDTPRIFNQLARELEEKGFIVLTPHLPHKLGRVPIGDLAQMLDTFILKEIGEETVIDLLGFSMGGLIARVWLQDLSGAKRTNKFISLGSPHKGTYTAQLVPSALFPGIGQMKRGSLFLQRLNWNSTSLNIVKCISFFCFFDLMVFPGWEAVLPVGASFQIPVLTHKGLISNLKGIDIIVREFLKTRQ